MTPLLNRFVVIVLILGARAVSVVAVAAHPGSTTTVAIEVRPAQTVEVTIVSDAEALLTKLDADSLASAPLLARVDLRANGVAVSLSINGIAVDANGLATIRLVGTIPPGARTLTWATPLVYGAYPVAVRAGGHETVRWLQGRETSEAFALDTAGPRTFLGVIWLGFTHIVPNGLDHILFVLGLLLLSTRASQLLLQVSAFTLAHSVTLGLCLYGVVSLPSRVVEPLIALSVAYVGLENLISTRLQSWRVAIVFAFGLLHGLGFAEALASLDLSPGDLVVTLVSFNAGVELGQLTVIASASALLYGTFGARHAQWRRPVMRLASSAVGLMGLVWTVERVM